MYKMSEPSNDRLMAVKRTEWQDSLGSHLDELDGAYDGLQDEYEES